MMNSAFMFSSHTFLIIAAYTDNTQFVRRSYRMFTRRIKIIPLFFVSLCMVFLSACSGTPTTSSQPSQPSQPSHAPTSGATSTQAVAPVDKTQSGDIPDTQAFVSYRSPAGSYVLDVPEGWARTASTTDVSFVDKFNGVQVTITPATTAPTFESVRSQQIATLQKNGHVVQDVQVKNVQLSAGTAVLLTFSSNSDPNPVTGKQIRLENNQYLFFKNGKLATLTLWAPISADNVDQWARMSRSFRWV